MRRKNSRALRIKRMKRKFRRFWREWGISLEELGMFFGAVSVVAFPLLLRIALAFFGI